MALCWWLLWRLKGERFRLSLEILAFRHSCLTDLEQVFILPFWLFQLALLLPSLSSLFLLSPFSPFIPSIASISPLSSSFTLSPSILFLPFPFFLSLPSPFSHFLPSIFSLLFLFSIFPKVLLFIVSPSTLFIFEVLHFVFSQVLLSASSLQLLWSYFVLQVVTFLFSFLLQPIFVFFQLLSWLPIQLIFSFATPLPSVLPILFRISLYFLFLIFPSEAAFLWLLLPLVWVPQPPFPIGSSLSFKPPLPPLWPQPFFIRLFLLVSPLQL